MVTLELNVEEQNMLARILTSYLSDLRFEVADTDRLEWREKLKGEEEFVKKLLNTLVS